MKNFIDIQRSLVVNLFEALLCFCSAASTLATWHSFGMLGNAASSICWTVYLNYLIPAGGVP